MMLALSFLRAAALRWVAACFVALTAVVDTIAAQSIEAPTVLITAHFPSQGVLTELVERAGDQIDWMQDPYARYDLARGSQRLQAPERVIDRTLLLDRALERARHEKKLVLVYVPRIEGRPMYRAPLLDDYMRLALWSDPATIELVNRRFVPLRLYVDRSVAARFGVDNVDSAAPQYLDALEPALFFLDGAGTVVHRVDRIRTFSTAWFRELARDVLRQQRASNTPSVSVELARAQVSALAAREDRSTVRSGVVAEDPAIEVEVWLAEQELKDGNEAAVGPILDAVAPRVAAFAESVQAALTELEAEKPDASSDAYALWARRFRAQTSQVRRAQQLAANLVLQRAGLLRTQRLHEQALQLLVGVEGSMAQELLAHPAYAVEVARCHIAAGRYGEAHAALSANAVETANMSPGAANHAAEAEWWRGVCCFKKGSIEAADRHFADTVAMAVHPWAARAAAMLAVAEDTTRRSPLAHGFEMLEVLEARSAAGTPAKSTVLQRDGRLPAVLEDTARDAFAYLLAQQCSDGSWRDARYAYWPSPTILPNVRVAVTSLAATALLTWRHIDPQRVDAALARAERYLCDDDRVALGTEEEVYAQAYRMLYWTRRVKARFGVRDEAVQNLGKLVARAAAIQDKGSGFFAHEYKNAFCTGSMLWSLWQVRQSGVVVEDDVILLGLSALRSARRDDGSFSYGGAAADRDAKRPAQESITRLKDASARMPVCEAVLHAFGTSDDARLAHAYETFLLYLDRLEKVRKADFHSDGELGGFFFWHAVFHASEACGPLSDELRGRVVARLRELVVRIQEIDGSFIDSHELGKSYGTAMALLTLANLR